MTSGSPPRGSMFIDCHAHLDPFADDEVGAILDRAARVGVRAVISDGVTLESTARSLELSAMHPAFFSGVGIHLKSKRENRTEPRARREKPRLRALPSPSPMGEGICRSRFTHGFGWLGCSPTCGFPLSRE